MLNSDHFLQVHLSEMVEYLYLIDNIRPNTRFECP
jgi:hypothetical protein